MDSPLFRRAGKRGFGGSGRANEKIKAKRLGAKLTPGSGAFNQKGDMVYRNFLVENKSTKKDSLALKKEWLLKIQHEAIMAGKLPALSLSFTTDSGADAPPGPWVIVPEWWFKDVLESRYPESPT